MRRFILGAALALALAGPVHAEDSAAAHAAQADSHLAAALDLLDATHSMDNVTTMLDALMPLQAREIKQARPNIDDATLAAIQKAVRDEMVGREDEYKVIVAKIYENHFSEDELHTLSAFYRSETGSKYIATLPAMIKEMTPVATAWAMQMATDAMQKVLHRMTPQGDHT